MRSTLFKNLFFSLVVLGFTGSAYALTLDEAKSKGLVGEKLDGYLGVVVENPEVQGLVTKINSERRQKYQEIASKNGTDLQAVESLAAKKAVQLTAPGRIVQRSSGQWEKK